MLSCSLGVLLCYKVCVREGMTGQKTHKESCLVPKSFRQMLSKSEASWPFVSSTEKSWPDKKREIKILASCRETLKVSKIEKKHKMQSLQGIRRKFKILPTESWWMQAYMKRQEPREMMHIKQKHEFREHERR